MYSKHDISLNLFFILTLFVFLVSFEQNRIYASDDVPVEASKNAEKLLNKLVERELAAPGFFRATFRLDQLGINEFDCTKVYLGKPYKRYYARPKIIAELGDMSTLSQYTEFKGYGFPMYYNNKYLGTIYVYNKLSKILKGEEDNYSGTGFITADQLRGDWIVEAQKKNSIEGVEYSYLQIEKGFGTYIVAIENGIVKRISAISSKSAEIINQSVGRDNRYPFEDLSETPLVRYIKASFENK